MTKARRTVVRPAGQPVSPNPLSPAVRVGDLLFVSGQTAGDAGDVEAQTRAALTKLGAILEAAGTGYANVVRCGVYLADISTFARMNAVYREFFTSEHPARSTIEAQLASPSVLVEIDCVAFVPDTDQHKGVAPT